VKYWVCLLWYHGKLCGDLMGDGEGKAIPYAVLILGIMQRKHQGGESHSIENIKLKYRGVKI